MSRWLKVISVVGAATLIVITFNLSYLPGPQSMFQLSNSVCNGAIALFILILLAAPVALVWLVVSLVRRKGNVTIPAAVLFVTCLIVLDIRYFSPYLREVSRERSIKEAVPIVDAIERFNAEFGTYPDSLAQLVPINLAVIPLPSSMGIRDYTYTVDDSLFELGFRQSIPPINFEVVFYNPQGLHRGKGEMPQLYETSAENWKYFIFD